MVEKAYETASTRNGMPRGGRTARRRSAERRGAQSTCAPSARSTRRRVAEWDDRFDRPAGPRAVDDGRARVDERNDHDEPEVACPVSTAVPSTASAVAPAASEAIISRRRSKRSAATRPARSAARAARTRPLPRSPSSPPIGQRERQQRVRDSGDPRPEGREQRAGLEEQEVAVAPQRDELGHASIVAAAPAPASSRTCDEIAGAGDDHDRHDQEEDPVVDEGRKQTRRSRSTSSGPPRA